MASWAQYRPYDPPTTMGRTAISSGIGRTASRTRLAERLVRAVVLGDDSQPRPLAKPVSVGVPRIPTSTARRVRSSSQSISRPADDFGRRRAYRSRRER